MKVNYKLVLIIVSAVILGFAILLVFNYLHHKGSFEIKIQNRTPEAIGALTISYKKIDQDIMISGIPSWASLTLVFKPREEFGENTMWLSYRDQKGVIHKEAVFGYFEKGYRGKAFIKIIKVESDGVIKFEIKSDVKAIY